jgi:tetratricopeptide (TPR) repeat protein
MLATWLEVYKMDRIALLRQFLDANPNDAFARYGLAMEYTKTGDLEGALAEYRKLLQLHPDYTAGYQMAAQALVGAERLDEAKQFLCDGIKSAERTGNPHAKSEMQAILDEISS